MDRCVVLVDAGYLLGAAASLLAGNPPGPASPSITGPSSGAAGARRGGDRAPLLRIYWFDGAPDRVPSPSTAGCASCRGSPSGSAP
ncbi:hypothetical protein NKH77_13985 [Streptomyces sp. M19]